jgi:cytidylate kinase
VAESLGYRRLDTGAMYRTVTLVAIREGVDPADGRALARLAGRIRFDLRDSEVLVDGRPAGHAIRSREVSALVSQVAAHPSLRRVLVRRQRELVGGGGVVAEGRDIGTVVCPDADLKVFLTATPGERARRRHRELGKTENEVTYETLKQEIRRRDTIDSTRAASPLKPAEDAIVIDSTGRSAKAVVAEIVDRARTLSDARRRG